MEGQNHGQQRLPGPNPGHEKTGGPAYGSGQQETGKPLPLPAGVESQTDGDEQINSPPARRQQAKQPDRRKEEEQERRGVKSHANINSN